MVAFQTTYGFYTDTDFLEGSISTTTPCKTRSAANQTAAVLPYGALLVVDSSGVVQLPSATGQKPVGVCIRRDIREFAEDANNRAGYPADARAFEYLESGDVAVYMETAFDPTSAVFFRHTANGAGKDVIGRFRVDNDGASGTVDQLLGVSIQNSGAAGELALLTLNLPV